MSAVPSRLTHGICGDSTDNPTIAGKWRGKSLGPRNRQDLEALSSQSVLNQQYHELSPSTDGPKIEAILSFEEP